MNGEAEAIRSTVAADPVGAFGKILSAELRPSGNEYVARCFHPEHHTNGDAHPSLRTNPQKSLWRCDPCGIGGDIFDLYAMMHGLDVRADFLHVVAGLAGLLGVNGADPAPRAERRRKRREEQGSDPADVEDLSPPTEKQVRALVASRRITRAETPERVGGRLVRWNGEEWLGIPTLAGSWKVLALDSAGRPRLDDRGIVRRNVGKVSLVVPRELCELNGSRIARLYDVEGESDLLALLDAGVMAAVTTTGGATSLAGHREHADFLMALHPAEAVVVRDLDESGRRGAETASDFYLRHGVPVRVLRLPAELGEGGDVRDFLLGRPAKNGDPARAPLGTFADLEKLADAAELLKPVEERNLDVRDASQRFSSPWARAIAAQDFLSSECDPIEWTAENVIAPGSITIAASPRGLGKTHFAHALAVAVVRGGEFRGHVLRPGRVLLIDRDNSKREVRRRLAGWGAADLRNLKILCRDEAPSLTDPAWKSFPFADYDVVILDSLSASAERVKDGEGGEWGAALAPLLDLARRGPGVVVLANTRKDGAVLRGAGTIGDRADIVFEVRDATDLDLDPKKAAWWDCLPEAGDAAWSDRSKRRRRRDDYRLAFVPSKFRIGEEPDPFAVEIRLADDGWSLRDVTEDVQTAHDEKKGEVVAERNREVDAALATLENAVRDAFTNGAQVTKTKAEEILKKAGLARLLARDTLNAQIGMLFETMPGMSTKKGGKPPTVIVPRGCNQERAAETTETQEPHETTIPGQGVFAGLAGQGRQKPQARNPLGDAQLRDDRLPPPETEDGVEEGTL